MPPTAQCYRNRMLFVFYCSTKPMNASVPGREGDRGVVSWLRGLGRVQWNKTLSLTHTHTDEEQRIAIMHTAHSQKMAACRNTHWSWWTSQCCHLRVIHTNLSVFLHRHLKTYRGRQWWKFDLRFFFPWEKTSHRAREEMQLKPPPTHTHRAMQTQRLPFVPFTSFPYTTHQL